MMLEQRVRPEHGKPEDGYSDHEQFEDVENAVDDVGKVVEEGWHVVLRFVFRNGNQPQNNEGARGLQGGKKGRAPHCI
jgi:hypothetical protein